ncbi:MAG: hypothetical protein D6808_03745 [Candidatus Dadabacteria bacterium]|nr:MAG: hypothetical protein D6808_03745 [Candidatus Dadabacteria bacterium]
MFNTGRNIGKACTDFLSQRGKEVMSSEANFFEKFGLEVGQGEVKVGETYPIYGMITKFISDTPGKVEVEINYSIKARMAIPSEKKVELLRERAFEPGIFISTVRSKDENGIVVDCSTVVFGKRQGFDA